MTLERHKSHLIPDVECTPDGIFVTDRDGSFPVRGKRRYGGTLACCCGRFVLNYSWMQLCVFVCIYLLTPLNELCVEIYCTIFIIVLLIFFYYNNNLYYLLLIALY